MSPSVAPTLPYRDDQDTRGLQALLISCRLDIQTLRRDAGVDDDPRNDSELSALEVRLRRLVRRLESAATALDNLFQMFGPSPAPGGGANASKDIQNDPGGLLSREADLRIKNSLQIITALLEKQANQAQGLETRLALQAATARIGAVARVHALLQDETASNGMVELDAYLKSVGLACAQAFGAAERGIILRIDLQPFSVQPDTARSVGIIVTELVTNAIRHAFPLVAEGNVRVAGEVTDSCYRLCVEDDGLGLPQYGSTPLAPRMGLVLVNALAAQVRAPLMVDVARGTRYTLALPI